MKLRISFQGNRKSNVSDSDLKCDIVKAEGPMAICTGRPTSLFPFDGWPVESVNREERNCCASTYGIYTTWLARRCVI